jgi:hypothetical protein
MLSKDQVFDQCARMHDERMEIHWCMVANGYAGKWECEAAACFFKIPAPPAPAPHKLTPEHEAVFHNLDVQDQVFNECTRLHNDTLGVHKCMIAKGYELGDWAWNSPGCKTIASFCYILGMPARRRRPEAEAPARDRMFDTCAHLHNDAWGIHDCMVANNYVSKWDCLSSSSCYLLLPAIAPLREHGARRLREEVQ